MAIQGQGPEEMGVQLAQGKAAKGKQLVGHQRMLRGSISLTFPS
jgi:hypothetical protein